MATAVTQGIRVTVKSQFIADRSAPRDKRFAFSYTVTIRNEGSETAQLLSRHWTIVDNEGGVQEVKGEGVVGVQPVLRPGESFEYTSWCVIPTPSGSMRGTYQMVRSQGEKFDAEIAPFRLGLPLTLN
ncbi:MAG: Co2+/Mg2+ efflux protein ApaG [Myxococcales bacterium]|nr:Co2+/Mg2+ efflux protein ApaG [Myxococcales bacterium]